MMGSKWDHILSLLPVQNPPTSEFSSSDLVWSDVELLGKKDRLCIIPNARVDDFVIGESNNKDCPTRFHTVKAIRRRSFNDIFQGTGALLVLKILQNEEHVCTCGNTYVVKYESTVRGCLCHFIVRRLSGDPSVVVIVYNQDKHIDKSGLPCHGPQDEEARKRRKLRQQLTQLTLN